MNDFFRNKDGDDNTSPIENEMNSTQEPPKEANEPIPVEDIPIEVTPSDVTTVEEAPIEPEHVEAIPVEPASVNPPYVEPEPIEPPKPSFSQFNQSNPYQQSAPTYESTGTYFNPVSSNAPLTPPVNNYFEPQQSFFTPPQVQNTASQTYVMPKKKKKNTTLIVIIILAAVCAIMAIAGIGSAVAKHIGDSDNDIPYSDFSEDSDDEDSEEDSDSNDSNTDSDAEAKIESSEDNPEKDDSGNYTAVGVVKNVINSCVGITVYTNQYSFYGGSNDGEKTAAGEGSGVIMAENNGTTYIMTCAHVIEGGDNFTVTLENDKEYEATFVGADSQTDIGVLSIKASGLQVAKFGNSDDIQIGEQCIAIGCPGGLEFKNSVTQGIVSALAVPIESSIGYKNECIQVDTAINPGNSGGALFNMQGQVIGINSSKIAATDYEGMGFAVPSSTAVKTANSLIKHGYVAGRAKIGIEYRSISSSQLLEELEEQGFKNVEGAMIIQSIDSNSDLKNKNVKQNDIIVAVDGKTLTSTDIMTSKLSKSSPGDTVELTIARRSSNGSYKIFKVKCKLIEGK